MAFDGIKRRATIHEPPIFEGQVLHQPEDQVLRLESLKTQTKFENALRAQQTPLMTSELVPSPPAIGGPSQTVKTACQGRVSRGKPLQRPIVAAHGAHMVVGAQTHRVVRRLVPNNTPQNADPNIPRKHIISWPEPPKAPRRYTTGTFDDRRTYCDSNGQSAQGEGYNPFDLIQMSNPGTVAASLEENHRAKAERAAGP